MRNALDHILRDSALEMLQTGFPPRNANPAFVSHVKLEYLALPPPQKKNMVESFSHINLEIIPGKSVFCTLASGVAEQGKITKSIFHVSILLYKHQAL